MPEQMLKQMRRVCKGDETTTTMAGRIYLKAEITIDPSKKPKTIDYQMTDGFTKGTTPPSIHGAGPSDAEGEGITLASGCL